MLLVGGRQIKAEHMFNNVRFDWIKSKDIEYSLLVTSVLRRRLVEIKQGRLIRY